MLLLKDILDGWRTHWGKFLALLGLIPVLAGVFTFAGGYGLLSSVYVMSQVFMLVAATVSLAVSILALPIGLWVAFTYRLQADEAQALMAVVVVAISWGLAFWIFVGEFLSRMSGSFMAVSLP